MKQQQNIRKKKNNINNKKFQIILAKSADWELNLIFDYSSTYFCLLINCLLNGEPETFSFKQINSKALNKNQFRQFKHEILNNRVLTYCEKGK